MDQIIKTFNFIGDSELFTAPMSGIYKFNLAGGHGGLGLTDGSTGGCGGTAEIYLRLRKGTSIWITIGGAGGNYSTTKDENGYYAAGGFNGGGNTTKSNTTGNISGGGGGGGATHIAFAPGTLDQLTINESSFIAAVAGGGGGGFYYNITSTSDKNEDIETIGGHGGGESGGYPYGRTSGSAHTKVKIPNQTTGNAFAVGQSKYSGGGGG